MKTILLWDLRFPERPGARLSVDDDFASAAVRSGAAAAADPLQAGALSAGATLDGGSPTEIVLQHGRDARTRRVVVPLSVALVGLAAGVAALTGAVLGGTPTPPPDTSSAVGSVALIWDSIGVGEGANGHIAFNQLGYPNTVSLLNVSSSGNTLANAYNQVNSGIVDSAYGTTGPAIAIVGDGTNDLANNGGSISATALYAIFTNMVALLKRKGFIVIGQKILPRGIGSFGWTQAQEDQRVAYNNLLQANSAGADLIVDYSAAPLNDPTNSTYFNTDLLHPKDAGQDVLAPRMKAAIAQLIFGNKRFPDAALSTSTGTVNAVFSATFTKIAGSTVTAISSDGTALTVTGNTISGTFTSNGIKTITITQSGAGFETKSNTAAVTIGAAANYLRLTTRNNLAEGGNAGSGYTYTPITDPGGYGTSTTYGRPAAVIPADEDGWVTMDVTADLPSAGPIIGLANISNPTTYNDMLVGIYQDSAGGRTKYSRLPTAQETAIPMAVGDKLRVERVGTTLRISVSKDGGATFTEDVAGRRTGIASNAPIYIIFFTGAAGAAGAISKPAGSANIV